VTAVDGLERTAFAAGRACRAGTQPASLGSTLMGGSAGAAAVFDFVEVFVCGAAFAFGAAFVFAAPALPVVLSLALRVAIAVLLVSRLTRRRRARPE
jgi:hypothetical protein